MAPLTLKTPHLDLVLEDTAAVLARIEALPPEDRAQVSDAWLDQLRASNPSPWTHGFGIVERSAGRVVGSCGYKGGPDDEGNVEIAYAIDTAFRGQGFAKEAATALVTFARASGGRGVRAHTLPAESPSTSVLRSCGFRKVGEVMDPEDGAVWRWEFAG